MVSTNSFSTHTGSGSACIVLTVTLLSNCNFNSRGTSRAFAAPLTDDTSGGFNSDDETIANATTAKAGPAFLLGRPPAAGLLPRCGVADCGAASTVLFAPSKCWYEQLSLF